MKKVTQLVLTYWGNSIDLTTIKRSKNEMKRNYILSVGVVLWLLRVNGDDNTNVPSSLSSIPIALNIVKINTSIIANANK